MKKQKFLTKFSQMQSKKPNSKGTLLADVFFAVLDLFHIIETRKSSLSFGTFSLGWKY